MKVIKTKPESSSMLVAGEEYSQIASGPNSFTSTRDKGNFINGPLSISSNIDNIRVGGIYKFNPVLASGLPSTMITPIPTLVLDMPVKNLSSMAAISAVLSVF